MHFDPLVGSPQRVMPIQPIQFLHEVSRTDGEAANGITFYRLSEGYQNLIITGRDSHPLS